MQEAAALIEDDQPVFDRTDHRAGRRMDVQHAMNVGALFRMLL